MITFITLYIVGFLRTLLVIAIIYFGIRIFTRYVLPLLLAKGIKNMQEKSQKQQRGAQNPRRPEGEVTIEGQPKSKKQQTNTDEEYIDFEEVE